MFWTPLSGLQGLDLVSLLIGGGSWTRPLRFHVTDSVAFICAVNIRDMASGGESSEEDNHSYYIVFASYKFFFKQHILLLVNIFYLGQCGDKVTFSVHRGLESQGRK